MLRRVAASTLDARCRRRSCISGDGERGWIRTTTTHSCEQVAVSAEDGAQWPGIRTGVANGERGLWPSKSFSWLSSWDVLWPPPHISARLLQMHGVQRQRRGLPSQLFKGFLRSKVFLGVPARGPTTMQAVHEAFGLSRRRRGRIPPRRVLWRSWTASPFGALGKLDLHADVGSFVSGWSLQGTTVLRGKMQGMPARKRGIRDRMHCRGQILLLHP